MTLRRSSCLVALALTSSLAASARAATLTVGPGKTYATPCTAIAVAAANDVVEVSPGAASYTDSCEINAAGLTVRGVGGRPVLDLSGTNHPADYKGIFVVNADGVTVENLEFTGANVDTDDGLNGAGIRDQASGLTVRSCYFHDNQDGILATPAVAGSSLTIEYTEFAHNGLGAGCDNAGCTHNVYVGANGSIEYETFVFAFNWSHDIADDLPDKGHLLKTRAEHNYILYNALLGETGHDSIELDIPYGGFSVVLGNILEKGPNADDNPNLLAYGEEGLVNPSTSLYVASNTFVSDYGSAVDFINVASGATLTAHDNLFVGTGTLSTTGALSADNLAATTASFVDPSTYDYHLVAGSPAIGAGVPAGSANGFSLVPVYEYVQPTASVARSAGQALDLGAFEFGTVVTGATDDAGVTLGDSGVPSLPDAGGSKGGGSDDGGSEADAGLGVRSDAAGAGSRDGGETDGGGKGGAARDGAVSVDGGSEREDAAKGATSGGSGGCTAGGAGDVSGWIWLGSASVAVALFGRRRARRGLP